MTLKKLWMACLAVLATACSAGESRNLAAAVTVTGAGVANATATPTLDGVRARDAVRCGVSTGIAGFSAQDAQGQWHGIDVDVCRAIAAAVLGDAGKVRYTPLTAAQRFTALQSGEIDILSRNTTVTFQRDVQLGIEFPVINWYDGTGFIVRKASNVKSVRDLNGATICIQPGSSSEGDIADYFSKNRLAFTPVVIERLEEVTNAYFAGRCDAFSQDRSALAAVRARAPNPADHVVLSEVISKAPLGPGVMPNDQRWLEIVRWSVYAQINAEELGLSSKTIDAALGSSDPDVRRFVGKTDDFGPMLGLDPQWAFRIIKQVGNYAESVERNITPLGIDRGINRLWKDGGVFYAPAVR